MKTFPRLWHYLAEFLLEREMFQPKFDEKIRTHILMFDEVFFRKSCRLWDKVEKYDRARGHRWYNKAHARCMLDK
jgi:hypothetical protein